MSGSVAAAGACPAQASCTPMRAVVTSRTVKIELRFMSRLLHFVGETVGFRIDLSCGRHLARRRHRRRQWLTDGQPHRSDLLLLGYDDLLSQPPDLRVATVAKHRDCHVDRTL